MNRFHSVRTVSRVLTLLVGMMVVAYGSILAQQPRIHHKIIKQTEHPPAMGREFWWAQPANYNDQDLGGKYLRVYITSPKNTTAYVQLLGQGSVTPVAVKAYTIGTFAMPKTYELNSSGVVENTSVHVWSNDADLTVYVMSHNAATSDGEYIVPTVGWGTDYVVAGYGALFEGFGAYVFDVPSEFTITANVDNTVVTITPSTDLRQSAAWPAGQNSVAYQRGIPFQVSLNRGQCVQYESVLAQNADDYDVSGSVVHSNYPVGVIGGSSCPNIPADYPYCDHVEDMMPPVRAWAQTYYTTNFIAPPGYPLHDVSLYLIISSKPGQKIFRHDAITGDHVECIIDNKYGVYWDELESAQKMWSDAPFLLVEYINSASYPDEAGLHVPIPGDPAEVVVNPREQYTQTVVFQTPVSVGSQSPYDNYATIIVNVKDELNTTFDKIKILSYTHQMVDDTFDVFCVPHIAPGAHVVTGDSLGVGVYIYGYGNDESYAWTGSFGTGTFHSPDTISPRVDTMGICYNATIHISDSGLLPSGDSQSRLSEIRLDSDYNMAYLLNPDWIEGAALDTGGYSMFVLDPTKPAYLSVEAYDEAGNQTTIISTYLPQVDTLVPPLTNLGTSVSGTALYAYDTIVNTGQAPMPVSNIVLQDAGLGFSIDSLPASPIPVGKKELVKIKFVAVKSSTVIDSLLLEDACRTLSVALTGNGGAADFLVEDQTWPNEPINGVPPNGYVDSVHVHNLSNIPIAIDKAWWADTIHFKPAQSFPLNVPASVLNGKQGTAKFAVAYFPDVNSVNKPDTTIGNWQSNINGTETARTDRLIGWGIAPQQAFRDDTEITIDCAKPGDMIPITFQLSALGTQKSTFNPIRQTNPTKFLNLTGVLENGDTLDLGSVQTLLGQTMNVTVDYFPPIGINEDDTDILTTKTIEGDSLSVRVIVHVNYRTDQVAPAQLTFGPVMYQSKPSAIDTAVFTITNPTSESLLIDTVNLAPGGTYNNAFTLTEWPPLNLTSIGTILGPGKTMQITVVFDPSTSFDTLQEAQIYVVTNACHDTEIRLSAYVTVPGVASTGYTPAPILSCDNQVDTITLLNFKPRNPNDPSVDANLSDTIESIQWLGAGTNFSVPNSIVGTVLNGSSTFPSPNQLPVPVTFRATPQPGLVTYTDSVQFVLLNSRGMFDTIVQPVTGIAGSVGVTATSVMKNVTNPGEGQNGAANDQMALPAAFTVNTNGLAIPIPQLGINKVILTYVIPNPDLLNVGQFSGQPTGWVPTVQSNNAGDTIVVTLDGTGAGAVPIDNTISSFGQLGFQVMLDKSAEETPVTLNSMQLFSNGAPVGPCIIPSVNSQDFSLVLRCGDSTMRLVMDNQGTLVDFIKPATPDPVTGNAVTFYYANRGATDITISVYDELGNEVARPVNNLHHDAGAWQVACDVSKLTSGTYTYRLSAQNAMGPVVISKQFVVRR